MRNVVDPRRNYTSHKEYKREINPITGPRCPECSMKLRFPDYVTMALKGGKIVSLTHRPFVFI